MKRAGRSRGFTLIEVLTVTVIIGVLAAIAIPQYYRVKAKAYVASMQSDLRNLVTAQEMYFAEHGRYTAQVGDLQNFRPTSGVTIDVTSASLQGWYAVASHSASTASCAIYVGGGSRPDAADSGGEGVPSCELDGTRVASPGERQP
ncbi:MAG TPA: prepilin-type N-terminal cleavage/methylation domain-containing protein [Gemmatimonadaceae bacterium]|nr:prepilin-type N-terminal cleavage/methylation domain-containing protein [Gemmatimonadaceae bacterium]